jgi:hypothetical protein
MARIVDISREHGIEFVEAGHSSVSAASSA